MPWLKITIIATLISSIVSSAWFYYHGKQVGTNEATIACTLALGSQQRAIEAANEKVRVMTQQQRDSYRVALNIRNEQYDTIRANLTEKERQLEVLINESTDACVNTPIPDAFK